MCVTPAQPMPLISVTSLPGEESLCFPGQVGARGGRGGWMAVKRQGRGTFWLGMLGGSGPGGTWCSYGTARALILTPSPVSPALHWAAYICTSNLNRVLGMQYGMKGKYFWLSPTLSTGLLACLFQHVRMGLPIWFLPSPKLDSHLQEPKGNVELIQCWDILSVPVVVRPNRHTTLSHHPVTNWARVLEYARILSKALGSPTVNLSWKGFLSGKFQKH